MSKSVRAHAARKKTGANPSGAHLLKESTVINQLVRSCALTESDTVVDLGAGPGAITAPLARTGARVLAVERNPHFVRELRNRFAANGNVRIVAGDLRTAVLPRAIFSVVASIPYAISTPILRRLLDSPATNLREASLIVEWGLAKRLTATVPRDATLAWWAGRFDITLVRRIRPHAFTPAPNVDSAHLTIRRDTGMNSRGQRALWALLDAAYRTPHAPVRGLARAAAGGRKPHRMLAECGIDPAAAACSVRPGEWAQLASMLAGDPSLWWPRVPDKRARG